MQIFRRAVGNAHTCALLPRRKLARRVIRDFFSKTGEQSEMCRFGFNREGFVYIFKFCRKKLYVMFLS